MTLLMGTPDIMYNYTDLRINAKLSKTIADLNKVLNTAIKDFKQHSSVTERRGALGTIGVDKD